MKSIRFRTPLALFIAALAGSASAQSVLFDFGTDSTFRGLSTVNPDTNGNHWNNVPVGTFEVDLVDITNTPTTIDFGFSTGVATDSFNGPAGATGDDPFVTLEEEADLDTDIDDAALGLLGGSLRAAFDFVAGPGAGIGSNQVRFEIQQLDPGSSYDLTFFGSHKFSADSTTVYSVYTDDTYTTLVDSVSLDVQDPEAVFNHNRDTTATLSGLSPQLNDILYVEFVGSTGENGYLNSLLLVGTASELEGDANGDGTVDLLDLDILGQEFGQSGAGLQADFNGDETVDLLDLDILGSNFGAAAGAASVPEPNTCLIAAATLVGALATRRRHVTA